MGQRGHDTRELTRERREWNRSSRWLKIESSTLNWAVGFLSFPLDNPSALFTYSKCQSRFFLTQRRTCSRALNVCRTRLLWNRQRSNQILLQRFNDAPFIPSKSQKRKRYTINNDVLGIPRSDGAEFSSSGNLLKGRRPSLAEENEDILNCTEDDRESIWEGLEIKVPPVAPYRPSTTRLPPRAPSRVSLAGSRRGSLPINDIELFNQERRGSGNCLIFEYLWGLFRTPKTLQVVQRHRVQWFR